MNKNCLSLIHYNLVMYRRINILVIMLILLLIMEQIVLILVTILILLINWVWE